MRAPTSPTTTRTCPSWRAAGSRRSRSTPAPTIASRSLRPIPRSTTRSSWTRPGWWSTSVMPPAGTAERTKKSGSYDQNRPRRPRLLGTEPRAELRRARGAGLALRPRPGPARALRPPLPERPRDRQLRRIAERPRARGRRDRDSCRDALRVGQARARGRQARSRREAARNERSGGGGPGLDGGGEWARAPARPPAALPPRRAGGEGPDGRGRARRGAVRLLEPPEPRQDPSRRERTLVARRPRPLRDPPPARRGAFRDLGTWQLVPHARSRGHRLLLPALPLRQNRAHAPLLARPAQDAKADRSREGKDGRLRRHGAGAQGDDLREGPVAADSHLRRVADPYRRHLQPEDPERRAVAARMPPLPRPRGRRGRPAAGGPGRACGRARARAAAGLAGSDTVLSTLRVQR